MSQCVSLFVYTPLIRPIKPRVLSSAVSVRRSVHGTSCNAITRKVFCGFKDGDFMGSLTKIDFKIVVLTDKMSIRIYINKPHPWTNLHDYILKTNILEYRTLRQAWQGLSWDIGKWHMEMSGCPTSFVNTTQSLKQKGRQHYALATFGFKMTTSQTSATPAVCSAAWNVKYYNKEIVCGRHYWTFVGGGGGGASQW